MLYFKLVGLSGHYTNTQNIKDSLMPIEVFVVEVWEDIPYGEYYGVEGVYKEREDAEKAASRLKEEDYIGLITKMELK